LQHDASHPPAALPHGLAQGARKVLARSHRLAVFKSDGHKRLAVSQGVQPEAVFVIFGEARGIENATPVAGQPLQRRALKPRPHSVRRQEPPQPLAHRDVLGLEFGKLVAVETVRQFAWPRRQRQHRHLHHGVIARVEVDQPQGFGMHQILRIVRRDDLKTAVAAGFRFHHRTVNLVQAVALGRRAVVRAEA
jgi:hypothetical protein